MICYLLFVFSIIVSVTADVFLINCGAASEDTDTTDRIWTPESSRLRLPSNSADASFSSDAVYQELGVRRVPYMTARIFRSGFTYSFPASPGWKFLRLYFYPTRYGSGFDAFDSFFSVNVNGFTLLNNFSADLTVKASKSKSLMKEFVVPVNQTLNLTFTPSPKSLAFVNGIEIVSMPDGLYSKGGFDVDFEIGNTTTFETVYRLNVGGREVRDTGMFQRWLSDDDFLRSESSELNPEVENATINYNEKTPAYVAPEDVYQTYRTMGGDYDSETAKYISLTWLFGVDAGFRYLVRLHFCETLREVNTTGQRVFSIFLNNRVAKLETDVIRLSGGSLVPMYLDFGLDVSLGDGPDIRLDLNNFNDSERRYLNAFLNGVEILKLNDSDGNLARPIPNPTPSPPPNLGNPEMPGRRKVHAVVITLIGVGSAIGLVTFIVVLLLLMRHMKRKNDKNENRVVMLKVLLKQYTFAEVRRITKSFSHTVGKGGFGTVYEGNLCNGRKVAVKVLKDLKGNGEDFINEIASMSQTSHVNIVSLLGFCYEGSKRAIIYEFLENGSLDQFISRKKPLTLDVTTLYGISLGVARGLEYLHYGCKTRIVHFDIKPQNILLDGNLCPKVSDFGLAKLCEKRESIMSLIDARGTIGYIAPEVFSRMYGGISHKSDVYSYGMLVLEMIGARNKEAFQTTASTASSIYFPDWIYKDLENEEQTWIFGDEITKEEKEIARKMILVSLWCIQPCPLDRPPMNRVVEMIEGSLDALEIPPKPSMHISTRLIIPESSSLSNSEEAGEETQTFDSTNT